MSSSRYTEADISAARALFKVNTNTPIAYIKKIYKKLVMQYHPDKNAASDAKEKFQSIQNAYEILKETQRNEVKEYSRELLFFSEKPKEKKEKTYSFGEWKADYNGCHLFIFHPKLKGFKDSITFWNLRAPMVAISLPINEYLRLYQRLKEILIPLIPSEEYWLTDSRVEITLKLPVRQEMGEQVLAHIFNIYQFPNELVDYVKAEMGSAHELGDQKTYQ